MKEIDKLIRDALRDEDSELAETLGGEQRMHQMILDLYRGRSRWLAISWTILTLLLMVVGIYAAVRFYDATMEKDMLLWGALALFSFAMVMAVKIWGWMEMSKNEVMREIKRLELQVVRLTTSLKNDTAKS